MKKEILVGFLLFLFVLTVYVFVAGEFKWQYNTTQFAYFNLLSESFLNLRLDLISPPANRFDLSEYQGRVYLYWGPLPSILLLPIITIFGVSVSDKLYTAFFGALNVLILYLILLELKRLLKNGIGLNDIILLTIFFAFGTVNFASSVVGRVWFTSQVFSLTAHLISLYFLLFFSRKERRFFLSLFFWLASLFGRLSYLLFFPIYLGGIFLTKLPKKKKFFYFLISFVVLIFGLGIYGVYNKYRFGSFFETGKSYQQEAGEYRSLKEKWGVYHPHYFLTNLWYQFLSPVKFKITFPFVEPNSIGNGIFLTSPLFLLLIYCLQPSPWRKYIKLFLSGVILYIFQLLFFFATGYFQFGARYLLDAVPLLILSLALVLKRVPRKIVYLLFIISIIICSLGAIWFATQPV